MAQARAAGAELVRTGRLSVRQVAAEDLVLLDGEEPYDLAVAVRVGALDGRHPAQGERGLGRLAVVLRPGGRLLVDGGREVPVPR